MSAPVADLWQAHASTAPTGRVTGANRLLIAIEHARHSQFEILKSWTGRREDLPTIVASLALRGTGFRGNRSREWIAAEGNLHLSVMCSCRLDAARVGPALSMLPVVATTELLESVLPGGAPTEIKWVNDVLIDGRKVAGLLTASSIRGGSIESALFGVGLNVATIPEVVATPFVPAVTALAEWIPPPLPGLLSLATRLIEQLENLLRELERDGPSALTASYRRRSGGIGREVAIWPDEAEQTAGFEPLARGRLAEIRDDLTLRLEGRADPVTRGRLSYEDGPAA